MKIAGFGCLFLVGALGCKAETSGPSAEAEPVAKADPVAEAGGKESQVGEEPANGKGPVATVEPAHPWPVMLLDARGHAPLPAGPRQDVWIAMEGVGATTASGEIKQLSALKDGHAENAQGYLLPELLSKIEEHPKRHARIVGGRARAGRDAGHGALHGRPGRVPRNTRSW